MNTEEIKTLCEFVIKKFPIVPQFPFTTKRGYKCVACWSIWDIKRNEKHEHDCVRQLAKKILKELKHGRKI